MEAVGGDEYSVDGEMMSVRIESFELRSRDFLFRGVAGRRLEAIIGGAVLAWCAMLQWSLHQRNWMRA